MARIDHRMSFIDLANTPLVSRLLGREMQFGTQELRKRAEPNHFSTQVSDARRFCLELNPSGTSRELIVTNGGWERCRPDYKIHRSGFSSPIIEFVARGAGTLLLDGKSYELRPGMVFVYGQRMPHHIQTSQDSALEKYFVAFKGGAELLRECHLLPGTVQQVMHPEQIQQIFDDLIAHGLGDHANRMRMCQIALQYLVMKIADDAATPGGADTAAVATYQRCRQFIEENALRVHSLSEVAAACHVDSAYLCRLFKRFRRESPFRYLQNLKMNRAVELLRNGNRSVKQTAQELGFTDPYNFSRAFKRIFGIAPQHMLEREKTE